MIMTRYSIKATGAQMPYGTLRFAILRCCIVWIWPLPQASNTHLYVPGNVLVMYDLWEKEQQRMPEEHRKESTKSLSNSISLPANNSSRLAVDLSGASVDGGINEWLCGWGWEKSSLYSFTLCVILNTHSSSLCLAFAPYRLYTPLRTTFTTAIFDFCTMPNAHSFSLNLVCASFNAVAASFSLCSMHPAHSSLDDKVRTSLHWASLLVVSPFSSFPSQLFACCEVSRL